MEADFPSGKMPLQFVKISNRKTDKALFSENEFVTTLYDVTDHGETFVNLYNILKSMYDYQGKELIVLPPENKRGTLTIKQWDNCGVLMSQWIAKQAYATEVNFLELEHANSSPCNMEVYWACDSIEHTVVNAEHL
jgi:hypothetical protein